MTTTADLIARHLRPGCRVAIADGCGAPVGLARALTEAAARVGGVDLLLGWSFALPVDLEFDGAFRDVRSIMGGYALRQAIGAGRVHYVPARIGAVPALLQGPLRPDVVVMTARPVPDGFTYGTEVAWLPAAVDTGVTVLALVNGSFPSATGEPSLDAERVEVVGTSQRPPHQVSAAPPDPASEAIGRIVARFVPAGATIQFGPGRIADAVLAELNVPVRVDSGIVTDSVVDLDARGLLVGTPTATYLVGTERLYRWADGRPILRRIEHTHDVARLSQQPLVAVNTALEIDADGAVNVEGVGGQVLAGIGGHGDYALAASRAATGLSICALPTARSGRSTLVEDLSAPTSTGYADTEVVVTERGAVDLRGLDGAERRAAIRSLWPS